MTPDCRAFIPDSRPFGIGNCSRSIDRPSPQTASPREKSLPVSVTAVTRKVVELHYQEFLFHRPELPGTFAYTVASPRVTSSMQLCALDDAYVFLTEAKGLPAIPSASARLRLCLRACILLSWVGLEEGLDRSAEEWGGRGRTLKGLPTRLRVRALAFLLPLSDPPLVGTEFDRLRKIRNHLVHPRAEESAPPLTLDDAEQTFHFCLKILRALNTYRIAARSHDVSGRSGAHMSIRRDAQKMPPAKDSRMNAVLPPIRKTALQ